MFSLNEAKWPKISFGQLMASKWPIFLGFAIVTGPTWYTIANVNWPTEQGSHGPLVLASGLWLLVRMAPEAVHCKEQPSPFLSTILIVSATISLMIFRAAAVIELEVYALYALFVTLVWSYMGLAGLEAIWFPLLYLLFAIPPPEIVVSLLTNPLKLFISGTATTVLYELGYPIAASGAAIQVGQYELLVADACAGLNSLITLTALSMFYVYLIHKSDWKYMALLATFVIPIAIFANLIRVFILVLLTFHWGEAAAQGFLHNFAGMTTFLIALALIYMVDVMGGRVRMFVARRETLLSQSGSSKRWSNGLRTK